MSRTLFWYIFGNLVKLFLLTTIGLAGIMSLAGLLRPLTEHGLDIWQVNRLLLYMMPAMCTYSLPVAALFAATMVYGRFSSDNELTAMRAGGIGYLSPRKFSIALPALVLGLLVAVISLLMLCFIVPLYSLKMEEVIYSNIAKVITSQITRDHVVEFKGSGSSGSIDVFAQDARLLPADPGDPGEQRVELDGPAFTTDSTSDPNYPELNIPNQFWMARTAVVTIRRDASTAAWQSAQLSVELDDGIRFPREFTAGAQAGVAETSFGPREIPSPIKENVKFMDVARLRELLANPGQSQKVTEVTTDYAKREQQRGFNQIVVAKLDGRADAAFDFPEDPDTHDQFRIGGRMAKAVNDNLDVIITAPPADNDPRSVYLVQRSGSQEIFIAHAREMRVRATPDLREASSPSPHRMIVSVTMLDTDIMTPKGGSEHPSGSRSFSVAMPTELIGLENQTVDDYLRDPKLNMAEHNWLEHEETVSINSVTSELHGRASFALSCLVLVMVGCALGVMFKSGNLLNAFAVSFVPAILCITLIVCGQTSATHVPEIGPGFHDPLSLALSFIWVGNAVVLATAIILTVRLQRQ